MPVARADVCWVPRNCDESLAQYFLRSEKEAGDQFPLAFRRGGGSSIGIRVLSQGPKRMLFAVWRRLSALRCRFWVFLEKNLPWLVTAVGPPGHVGILPIEAEDTKQTMLLTQVASGSARPHAEVERLGVKLRPQQSKPETFLCPLRSRRQGRWTGLRSLESLTQTRVVRLRMKLRVLRKGCLEGLVVVGPLPRIGLLVTTQLCLWTRFNC